MVTIFFFPTARALSGFFFILILKLFVSSAVSRMDPERDCKLFIGGLNVSTSTEGLRDFYSQWGEIIDCVVMKDPMTKRSRGFGFVTYADPHSIDTCMSSRPHIIDGREVEAKRAVPKEDSTPQALARTKKIFLGGLHLDTCDEEVRDTLEKFGKVEEVVIKRDPQTDKPRGFGFAIFDDFDAVDKITAKHFVHIHDRDVEIKKAQSAEELRRRDGGGGGGGNHQSSHRDRSYSSGRGSSGGGGGGSVYSREGGYGGYPSYPGYSYPSYSREYYRQDPYMSGAGGYGYGDRSTVYAYPRAAAAAAAAGYDTSGSAAYGMYSQSSYGSSASGYGPMRNYTASSNGAGPYNGRPAASSRAYHPYKR